MFLYSCQNHFINSLSRRISDGSFNSTPGDRPASCAGESVLERTHAERVQFLAGNIDAHFGRNVAIMTDPAADSMIRFVFIALQAAVDDHDRNPEARRGQPFGRFLRRRRAIADHDIVGRRFRRLRCHPEQDRGHKAQFPVARDELRLLEQRVFIAVDNAAEQAVVIVPAQWIGPRP